MRMVPALSVTYLPLAVPITLPSESVTKNSTSEIGALVTASFLTINSEPILSLPKVTVMTS